MAKQNLSEPYVLGLLTDLEIEVPRLQAELVAAKNRAARIDAELSQVVRRMDENKAALAAARRRIDDLGADVSERNSRTATLHQEIGAIQKRADDLKIEMDRVGPGEVFNRLRRDRARLLVQIDDRQKELARLRQEVEAARHSLMETERELSARRDKSRVILRELDALQAQLPTPHLYLHLAETLLGRAHTRYHVDHDIGAWRREVVSAIGLVQTLHTELRSGKYRLDTNSDVVGGRAVATAEALFATAILGDPEVGRRLFAAASDEALLFDQIFHVFRTWCAGLYLSRRFDELRVLLRRHQFATGLRGAYVQAFTGLLEGDARRVTVGLRSLAKEEWEVWLDPKGVRGLGVLNMAGLAIAHWAFVGGLRIEGTFATIPWALLPTQDKVRSSAR